MRNFIQKFGADKLYAGSFFLLLNSFVLSGLGFAFWIVAAHFFPATEVGIATALLAALNLITSASLLGFEISIIRILPGHQDKSKLLNVCLTITGLTGIVLSAGFLKLQPLIASSLSVVRANWWIMALFVLFTLFQTSSYIVESALVAYQKSAYIVYKNLIFSVLKVCLIVAFIGLGAFGIYSAWMVALGVAVIYTLYVLKKQFGHKFKLDLSKRPLKGAIRYSFDNYVAAFLEGMPIMILPLMITNFYGPVQNARYYIAMMLATFLFTVSESASQSLFADGSHSQIDLKLKTTKALKFVATFLVPGIAATYVLAPYLLLIFGRTYASPVNTQLLQLLAVSAIFTSLNAVGRTLLKIRYQTGLLVAIDVAGCALLLGTAFVFRSGGLLAIGYAWVFGQAATTLLLAVASRYRTRLVAAPASA
jgi:O-antigen/teichoic acid export membrane protein